MQGCWNFGIYPFEQSCVCVCTVHIGVCLSVLVEKGRGAVEPEDREKCRA